MHRDLRVAVVGNVDSGKSTLIGTLVKGDLDNGRGLSRSCVFRYQHEAACGRTSSVSVSYLGFDASGEQIILKKHGRGKDWAELAKVAARRVQLIDLAGHEKYLKTTVFGLTGMQPDIAMVVVGANMGVKRMTKEHLGIAIALDIPLVVVMTKIDIAPKNVALETMKAIRAHLKNANKLPMVVKTIAQTGTAMDSLASNRITPIFPISNVTGDGLDNVRCLLGNSKPDMFLMHLNRLEKKSNQDDASVELPIDEVYQVPGVGFVVTGTVVKGSIQVNDALMVGPDHHGEFHPVLVKSMHSMRTPILQVPTGQNASLAVRSTDKKFTLNRSTFRKGMVLVNVGFDFAPQVSRMFEARVVILHHQTTITKGYQPLVNLRTIRQSAKIESLSTSDGSEIIRTGDRALVQFKFLKSPEFIPVKTRFIFRDGNAKGIGRVLRILHDEDNNKNN